VLVLLNESLFSLYNPDGFKTVIANCSRDFSLPFTPNDRTKTNETKSIVIAKPIKDDGRGSNTSKEHPIDEHPIDIAYRIRRARRTSIIDEKAYGLLVNNILAIKKGEKLKGFL